MIGRKNSKISKAILPVLSCRLSRHRASKVCVANCIFFSNFVGFAFMYALLAIDVKRVAAAGGLDPFFPTSLGATHAYMRQLIAAKCLNERGVDVWLEQPWTMATLVMPTMMIGAGNADVSSRIFLRALIPCVFPSIDFWPNSDARTHCRSLTQVVLWLAQLCRRVGKGQLGRL